MTCTCKHKGTSVNHVPGCPLHEPPPPPLLGLEERFLLPWQLAMAKKVR